MEPDRHRVVGLYSSRETAASARELVVDGGVPPAQLTLQVPGSVPSEDDVPADGGDAIKDVLRDGANITLFVANPLLGALYLLGWGASLGGFLGAVVGSERSKGDVSNLIRDALAVGQFVLIVQTMSEDETAIVRRIVGGSMATAKAATADVPRPLVMLP